MARPYLAKATMNDVLYVARNMRQRDFDEICATSFTDDRQELAEEMAMRLRGQPMAFAVGDMDINGGAPIVCIAWVETHPGVWQVGMFATDDMPRVGPFLTKQVCRKITPLLGEIGANRVYANSICGYESVHKWLKFLGLSHEAQLPQHGKDGQDFICFSWIRPKGSKTLTWFGPGNVA